ncbi:MAG TPA: sugar ABC transporter permease [Mobilitalea sp.]|nr:sugar ABC transporter permease [Mobilitalea sp.]
MKKNTLARIGFSLPFLIPLFLFWIIPLISAFSISFTDWDYISPKFNFVGFDNYKDMFLDTDFLRALQNTFAFAFGTILPTIVLGFLLALIFQKAFGGSKLFQIIIFSPWITPAVAVSMVWSWIYDPEKGFANYLLALFGLGPSSWLQSSKTAMLAIIIFTIWKSVGWTFLFYIGALSQVPKSLYEASDVDGASYLRKLWHITVPYISPTTFFLIIVNLIQSIQVYDQIQIMTQGGPGGSTTTLLYLYYDKSFQNYQMGPANAVAIIILVIIILLSLLSNRVSKRFVHYE